MDFGQAVLLVGATFGLTKWLLSLVPTLDSRIKPVIAMGVAIGMVFLVSETVWSNENIIQGHSLEGLDGWSKLFIGIVLGLGAVVLDTGFKAVRNIGQNDNADLVMSSTIESVPPTT